MLRATFFTLVLLAAGCGPQPTKAQPDAGVYADVFDDDRPASKATPSPQTPMPAKEQPSPARKLLAPEALSEKPDVRGVNWLWSVADVRKAESIRLEPSRGLGPNIQGLFGSDSVRAHTFDILFIFLEDKLVEIQCGFEGGRPDIIYRDIHKVLEARYGNAMRLQEVLIAEAKKDGVTEELTENQKLMLEVAGDLKRAAYFSTPRTLVHLSVEDDKVFLRYLPHFKEAADLQKRAERISNSHLEKLNKSRL